MPYINSVFTQYVKSTTAGFVKVKLSHSGCSLHNSLTRLVCRQKCATVWSIQMTTTSKLVRKLILFGQRLKVYLFHTVMDTVWHRIVMFL